MDGFDCESWQPEPSRVPKECILDLTLFTVIESQDSRSWKEPPEVIESRGRCPQDHVTVADTPVFWWLFLSALSASDGDACWSRLNFRLSQLLSCTPMSF